MSDDENQPASAFRDTHAAQGAAAGARSGSVVALPGDDRADEQRLDGILPLAISPLAATGPGRPKGSKNRRTDLVAQYLVDRFGDPLTATMATGSMPLRDLIRELRTVASDVGMKLGGSVMDVARFQRDCRNDALPYIHAKRAPETAKGDPVIPVIAIGRFEQRTTVINGAAQSMEDEIARRFANSEPDQGVTTIDAEVSHGQVSHDERKPDEH